MCWHVAEYEQPAFLLPGDFSPGGEPSGTVFLKHDRGHRTHPLGTGGVAIAGRTATGGARHPFPIDAVGMRGTGRQDRRGVYEQDDGEDDESEPSRHRNSLRREVGIYRPSEVFRQR